MIEQLKSAVRVFRQAALVAVAGALVAVVMAGSSGFPVIGQALAQNASGLPLPRFVSFRSEEVNMRTGPGIQYPVDWVYSRRGLPVEIIAEFETWRKIRDWEGTQGWVHQSLLSGKRTVIITGDIRNLRAKPDASSRVIAKLEPTVLGDLEGCSGGWCQIGVRNMRGWVRHVDMWGVYKDEAFE